MKKFFLKFNKLITPILLIGIIIIAYFIFFNKNIQTASAGWWNDSWHYRKSIQITNNVTTETNVYASTTIDTSDTTKFQADCGDLRFTKYVGEVLPYYIVSGCGTATTTVHINFETFEAGTQTIFYYYGNPTADNGFTASDFSTEASDYTIGTVGSEEIGGGPVGYWSFNEGYGATAHDESSGGNDGTITGAVWKDESECITGKCLYFDGDQDYVVASSTINPSLTDFTVSLWMKDNAVDSTADVIMDQMAGSGVSREFIQIRITNVISSYLGNTSRDSTKTAVKSEWIHVELVHNNSANTLTWYINGNFSNTITSFTSNSADGDFVFGIDDALSAYDFHGYLDEIKTYNYARTADQIKQDYNAGLAGASAQSGTAVSFGSQSDKWLSDGLVGHWKMDETATTSGAIDASGNGNNGTYVGDASTTAGKFGRGGIFDGTDDYVDCGTFETVEGVNVLSVSAWIKWGGVADQLTGRANILGKEKAISFRSDDTGHEIFLDLNIGNTWHNSGSSITAIDDGIWHHVVGNYDGEYIRIFVDGVEENRTAYSGAITTSATDYNLFIGSVINLQHWTGQIDEVRVYNRALSQDEVKKLYEYAPGPVLHLKMDEKVSGDAQTLSDISGNGNNGTTVDGANNTGMNCTVQGKYGSGCEFDGVDDYVDAESINLTGGHTISAWVSLNDLITPWKYYPIIGQDGNDQNSFWISLRGNPTNSFDITWRPGASSYPVATELTLPLRNEYFHVAVVRNGSGNVLAYVNGIDVTTETVNNVEAFDTNPLLIGKRNVDKYFDGQIDDVRIYNYARTQKQILEDMAGTSAGASASRGAALGKPVLNLDFDEGFGASAHNKGIGGASLDGTLTPGAGGTNTTATQMWSLDGKNGKAMEFDGTDDYVSLVDPNVTDQFTVSAWIKSEIADPQWKHAVSYYPGFAITGDQNNDEIHFLLNTGTETSVTFDNIANIGTEWHHYIATYDGAEIKTYLDGKFENSTAKTGNILTTGDFNIGSYWDGHNSTYTWNGRIDEVKIFNYALTEDDIKTVYNSGVSAVMGSSGTDSATGNPTNASSGEYCVPGDTSTCDAPVLHLKMDEKVSGDAQTLYDISGNGNNGTTVDGANNTGMDCSVLGKYGSGCEFDGVDDYVSNINDIEFGGTNPITVCSWINTDTLVGVHTIIAQSTEIVLRLSGSDIEWILNSFTTNDRVDVAHGISADSWNYFCGTYESGSDMIAYVNGQEAGRVTPTGTYLNDPNSFDLGMLGMSEYWNGQIDDVRIYNYARTPAQIAWDYNKGKPIAEWRFDECQGTVIHNDASTGSMFNGTLNQGATGITVPGTCKDGLSTSAWYLGSTGHQKASMYFDGLSDYVEILDNDLLDFTNSLTLSAWIKPTAAAQSLYSRIISKTPTGGGNELYALVTDNSPSNTPGIRITVGSTVNCFGNSIAPLNEWTHVLGTWNGTVSKLYFNGVLENTCAIAGTLPSATSNLRIGDREDSPDNRRFKGMIDEVEIFNYVMTDEQIKNEFNSGAVRFGE